jgi:hypothetical protein
MYKRKVMYMVLSLLVGICLLADYSVVHAQATGTIYGTARDERGALLAGVVVTTRNEATGLVRKDVTNDDGGYEVSLLPVGS